MEGAERAFRWFNLGEGAFWIALGLGLFVRAAVRRENARLLLVAGLLFLAFGLSDFVEIRTGGWYKPWWLLAWKGANLAGLLGVCLQLSRQAVAAPSAAEATRDRFYQGLLILSTTAFSWLAMMVAHELGHVLHLWLSGGRVDYVVLHPLALSYTHPGENPHPLFVAWGGVVWGCLLPLILWLVVRRAAQTYAYLAAFFAGFCLIANGAYLAGDAFLQGGDARELIGHGMPPWLLVALGLPAVVLGLWFWNGLGSHFGLGADRRPVDRRAALAMAIALAVLVTVEVLLAG